MAIDLSKYCGTDIFREYLHEPFNFGQYTYATNGHILVRVPQRDGFGPLKKEFDIERPLKGVDTTSMSALSHLPLPPIPASRNEECEDCEGSGHEHECPDCTCECSSCDGTGTVTVESNISTTIRGLFYNLKYIAMALDLPGVVFADQTDDGDPFLFKFDGGVGAIMPMRYKSSEHVEIEQVDRAA